MSATPVVLVDETSDRKRIRRSPRTLATEVYSVLKEDILTCQLVPGQMINESKLAQSFEVSKTPIREALRMLIQEGLVEALPSIGYRVVPIELEDLQQLYDMQKILEAAAVERAIPRITERQLAELEELKGETFMLSDRESVIRWFKMNDRFHLAIAEISGNQRLVGMLRSVLDEMFRPSFLSEFRSNRSTEEFVEHHKQIVNAIRERDAELAIRFLHRQSDVGIASVIERLREGMQADGGQSSMGS
jgi:DNA-binding GntR family transcriptional regulator